MGSKKVSLEESLERLYALKKLQESDLNVRGAAITGKIIKAFEERRSNGSNNQKRGSSGQGRERRKI